MFHTVELYVLEILFFLRSSFTSHAFQRHDVPMKNHAQQNKYDIMLLSKDVDVYTVLKFISKVNLPTNTNFEV